MAGPEVSHGRGGAGNINPDDTRYVDGEVVRVGVEGSHEDGAFSTGRGGSGNIGDPKTSAPTRADKVLVPGVAAVPPRDAEDYHTGRGGAGNEHVGSGSGSGSSGKGGADDETRKGGADDEAKNGGAGPPVSLADKLKGKLFSAFGKK